MGALVTLALGPPRPEGTGGKLPEVVMATEDGVNTWVGDNGEL